MNFERKGKHLSEITPAGRSILEIASKILEEVENIKVFRKTLMIPTQVLYL